MRRLVLLLCAFFVLGNINTLLWASLIEPNGSKVRRLAIDVGSSSIDIAIADVDEQSRTIERTLYRSKVEIPIRDSIVQSGTERLDSEMQGRIVDVLQGAIDHARELGATQYALVGTSGLRLAENSGTVVSKIEEETGLKLDIISIRQEAYLGFMSAVSGTGWSPNLLIVWDLGGGTVEMIAETAEGELEVYTSQMGSLPFMENVIREVKRENPRVVRTPNPLTKKEIEEAIALGRASAEEVPQSLRELAARPGAIIVGIGGFVHLAVDSEDNYFTLDQINNALESFIGKSDNKIREGKLPPQAVTNLALVAGYMEELGVLRITVYAINLTDGLLVAPGYNEAIPLREEE